MERFRELATEGRTILLVSHGDHQMESLCSRAILFDHGRLIAAGSPVDVNTVYERLRKKTSNAGDAGR